MSSSSSKTASNSLSGKIISQIIGFVFCIGMPAAVTAIAPVSWIKFQRQGDRVTAEAKTCLLFVIPYKTARIDPVLGFGDRTNNGTLTRSRRSGGSDHYVRSEAEGFLAIQGKDDAVEIPVTPYNLKSVLEKSEAFLKDPKSTDLRLFVVANWKFSVIAGGLVSLFTVLYVVGVVLSIGKLILRLAVPKKPKPAPGADSLPRSIEL